MPGFLVEPRTEWKEQAICFQVAPKAAGEVCMRHIGMSTFFISSTTLALNTVRLG